MALHEPWRASLREVLSGIRAGRWSGRDVVEAALDARLPAWNAYRCLEPDRARAHVGEGPLAGVPISVKDLYGCPGFDTFAGSPRPLPPSYERPGPLMRRLIRQGANPIGKTHTVEFAFGGIGTNEHWGTPRNPRRPGAVPGGSTSGAAASLLEGSAWLAMGSDTAGSARIPASFAGVAGFKPAPGFWSTEGIVPLSATLDTPGMLARTVDDLALGVGLLEGFAVPETLDVDVGQLRLRRLDGLDADEPDVQTGVEQALERLGAAGARVEHGRVPEVGAALRLFAKGTVTGAECYAYLRTHLGPWIDTLETKVKTRVEKGAAVPAHEYLRRRNRIERLRTQVQDRFRFGELWVGPTTAITAPTLEAVADPEDYNRLNLRTLWNTSVANTLGLAALSLPVSVAGSPVGLMLMAPAGSERWLLEAGRAIERILGPAPDVFPEPRT